jgi:hypothetical protein
MSERFDMCVPFGFIFLMTPSDSEETFEVPDDQLPSPKQLFEEAQLETNRRRLKVCIDTIRLLRNDKGFSFREIADWLTARGITSDHNSVYRAYMKSLTPEEEHELSEREHMEAMENHGNEP